MTDTSIQYSNNMPKPNMSKKNMPKPKKLLKFLSNPLLLMLLLFGLPYALSWYFLYGGDPISFEQPNNNGELVSPVIPLGQFSLPLKDGTTLTNADLSGNWSIMTVTSNCEKACQETLFTMRQVRKAMGVNRQVIKPLVLLQSPEALEALKLDLSKDFPQLAIVSSQNTSTQTFTTAFSSVTPEIENSIFMVDPYGNLMMVYPADSDQKGMLDDFKRLLKVNKPKL